MMQKTPSDILFLEINDIITLQKLQLFKCCTNLPRRDFFYTISIFHIFIYCCHSYLERNPNLVLMYSIVCTYMPATYLYLVNSC